MPVLQREELEKQLTVEIKDKSWEEEKEGLVKITLESFSEDKIVIRKVYNKSSEQGYIFTIEGWRSGYLPKGRERTV